MRQKVLTRVEREIEEVYCDKCGEKKVNQVFLICVMCERDICQKCFGKHRKEVKGIYVTPCPFCMRLVYKYAKTLAGLFKSSDEFRDRAFDVQREWRKESLTLK